MFTLKWIDSEPSVITHLYSEDLVRQQQAEIEALEASKDRLIKTLLDVKGAEPVAWMNRLGRLEYEQGNGFEIPLYTHPAKTLTDEEIKEILQTDFNDYYIEDIDLVEFARAILKKASEK
jgi:hypothetical protein